MFLGCKTHKMQSIIDTFWDITAVAGKKPPQLQKKDGIERANRLTMLVKNKLQQIVFQMAQKVQLGIM